MQLSWLRESLLLDAIWRVLNAAAEALGIRALLVHAKHDRAADSYRKQAGFEPLSGDPLKDASRLQIGRRPGFIYR